MAVSSAGNHSTKASSSKWGFATRLLGAVQAAAGTAAMVAGAALCKAGWGGAIIGVPLMLIGADQVVTGLRTVASGEFKVSGVASAAGELAKMAGVSESTAEKITGVVDFSAGLTSVAGLLKGVGKGGVKISAKGKTKKIGQEILESLVELAVKTRIGDSRYCETRTNGDPISMLTGEELLELTDFYIDGPIALSWKRLYRSSNNTINGLGVGWSHSFSDYIETYEDGIFWNDDEHRRISFPSIDIGSSYFHPVELCTLSRPNKKTFCIMDVNRLSQHFTEISIERYVLTMITDENNNKILLRYDASLHLTAIENLSDQGCSVEYRIARNAQQQITAIDRIDPQSEKSIQSLVEYEYSEDGDLTAFNDSVNEGEQYTYQNHIITRRCFRSGYSICFEWDEYTPQGKCLRQWGDKGYYQYEFSWNDRDGYNICRNGNGAISKYKYNDQGLLVEEVDGEGHSQHHEYNEHGWLIKTTDGMGNTSSYTYDDRGNVTQMCDPLGQKTEAHYNAQNQLTILTDARGYQWQRLFNESGKISQLIDPLGAVTEWLYSSRQLPTHIIHGDGSQERLIWNAKKQLERSVIQASSGEIAQEFNYLYDSLGRIQKITYPDQSIATLTYDKLDRLIRAEHQGQITEYKYDGLGRLLRIAHADGSEEKLSYDSMGGINFYQDKAQAVTRWFYEDGLSQPSRRENSDGSVFNYEYDGERNLSALINENGDRHELYYDGNDRVIAENGFDGRCKSYHYNAAGHLIHSLDEDGSAFNFIRDALGQLCEIRDDEGRVSAFKYNPVGAILEAENAHSLVQFLYDPVGNLLREQQGDSLIQHNYDEQGRCISTMTPNGKTIDYQYEFSGGLQKVSYGGRQITEIQRDALGRIQKQTQGALTTLTNYDPQGRLAAMRTYRDQQAQAKPILATAYQYNRQGYVEQIKDITRGNTQYHYDTRERLVKVDGISEESFAFDPAGNILEKTDHQDSSDHRVNTQRQGNRLRFHGDRKFKYDSTGNLIEERRGKNGCRITRFTYNSQNQLISVKKDQQSFEFDYDAFGRRIRKRDRFGETEFIWNGDVLLSEQRNNYHRIYVFFPNSFVPLAFIQEDEIFHYRTDHLGTPQEVANDEGEVVWQVRYKAYGNVAQVYEEQIDNPIRFQGQYFDVDLDLHYNRHRYYDPSIGRYISQDPIGLLGGVNGYAYGVNPIGWVDPFGLCGEDGAYKGVPKRFRSVIEKGGIDLKANIAEAERMSLSEWEKAVKTGGKWDYKNKLSDLNIDPSILDDFGNFHFGIVSAAKGFNLEGSMYGAGLNQVMRQGGGNPGDLMIATKILSQTLGGYVLPDIVSRKMTNAGFTWGDNVGDAINVMIGWDFYDSQKP